MFMATRDTVMFKTPHGHEVLAELDYTNFSLCQAKVVHGYTGVIKPLEDRVAYDLARALHAQQIYEFALHEKQVVEETIEGFGEIIAALLPTHPAVEPYWREAQQHNAIAQDMHERARFFHETAMKAIDSIAED